MARRVSLREFQQDLVRRLNEAAAADAPSARLGIQVGPELWLVRLEEAGEVMPVPAIANVPLTRGWFRGLANIRGNLFSVIDLSAFQGGEPTPHTPDSRLLLVAERYHLNAALLVNRMLGLRNLQHFEPRPGESERPWEAGRFADREGQVWRELSMNELVYSEGFLQTGI
ncbi:MAG TPA: chemotaxis protein CheW [Burkholderiales bacterium]|nr:chemotaxis protein CheW [Burkholderiales bacterium]